MPAPAAVPHTGVLRVRAKVPVGPARRTLIGPDPRLVVFELIWRDFYRFYALKHGNDIFKLLGPARVAQPWVSDPTLLQRWKDGRTGSPLVDANMRELLLTGFMSNRGRQNVASYLALDLQLDWRTGADHFESLLLDYDVCSNCARAADRHASRRRPRSGPTCL